MTDRLKVLGFRAAWMFVPRMPEAAASRLSDLLADLAWLCNRRAVRRLQANLARVTKRRYDDPELRAMTRRALRSYGRYWREMFSIDGWSQREIDRHMRVEGKEFLDAALAEGRGAVIAATHSGNWDLPGVWGGRTYGRATTVAERLKPEELFDAFVAMRTKFGLEIVPHQGGPRPPFTVLKERVQAGGIVALVSDRDLTNNGVEVQFFGATARMAAGPAALARSSGAVLLPAAVWNDGDTVVFQIHEPLPVSREESVQAITQRLADVFAVDIAAHPEDWHMLQRVWIGAD